MAPQPNFPHHREFTRVQLPINALVTMNGVTRSVPVRDVSLNGISVHADPPFEQGTPCKVELRREDAPDEPWITAHGTVVRVSAEIVAIHLLDLVGIDSLDSLRSLLLYHAEDPDQLLAEFHAHWGLRPRQPEL